MVQVSQPQRKQVENQDEKMLGLLGAGLGFAAGGPMGAMQGYGMGQQLGGLVSPKQAPQAEPQMIDNALSRRMNKIENSDISTIRKSIDSLKYIQDPDQRMALAKPLMQAEYLAKS